MIETAMWEASNASSYEFNNITQHPRYFVFCLLVVLAYKHCAVQLFKLQGWIKPHPNSPSCLDNRIDTLRDIASHLGILEGV